MKKKGFVSMTLVYSFLTIFLFVMAAIMASQTEKTNYVEFVNNKVNEDLDSLKTKSISIMKRMVEDNFITDGSIFVIGDVANTAVGNGNGLYFLNSVDEDADTTVSRIYFYRGNVENNYAKIGNMCFRIIRTNEDNNVRMMYIGRSTSGCNSASMSSEDNSKLQGKKFNLLGNDNAFVGYMYGKAQSQLHDISSTSLNEQIFSNRIDDSTKKHTEYEDTHNFYEYDLTKSTATTPDYLSGGYRFFYLIDNRLEYFENQSNAKRLLDSWYEANIATLSSMVTDSSFCINRVPVSGTGVGVVATNYNVSSVNYTEAPFKCTQEQDRLTLSNFKGGVNSAYNSLEYPVGLVTVSDVLYAGGGFSKNNTNYYLHTGSSYWTMSPYSYENPNAYEIIVNGSGSIAPSAVTSTNNLYPVISIDGNTLVNSGQGTKADPYVLESAVITYTVAYRGNGAEDGTMVNSVYKLDEQAPLRKNTYSREGYTFLGWSKNKEATTASFTDEQQIKNLTYEKGGVIELFAVWQQNS